MNIAIALLYFINYRQRTKVLKMAGIFVVCVVYLILIQFILKFCGRIPLTWFDHFAIYFGNLGTALEYLPELSESTKILNTHTPEDGLPLYSPHHYKMGCPKTKRLEVSGLLALKMVKYGCSSVKENSPISEVHPSF